MATTALQAIGYGEFGPKWVLENKANFRVLPGAGKEAARLGRDADLDRWDIGCYAKGFA